MKSFAVIAAGAVLSWAFFIGGGLLLGGLIAFAFQLGGLGR